MVESASRTIPCPGTTVIEMWSVWWTDPGHVRRFIDVDDLSSAELLAVHLTEADRDKVVIAHDEIEWDRIALEQRRERLMARISGDPADHAMRERNG